MKQFENFFRTFSVLVLLLCLPAGGNCSEAEDSIEIGLVTCSPHEEIYSLYGHTALRYHNLRTGDDIVFNYGVFNYKKPFFVLRFVFGLTDYELGVAPFDAFCDYYRQWGSSVDEQVLNLSPLEKRQVCQALATNLRPENRVYRYNFLYDNCATRPRDIIEGNIVGSIAYSEDDVEPVTFRQMIRQQAKGHPWAAFGNDLLLGLKADQPTTMRQQEFLPSCLYRDFANAKIVRLDTVTRLVERHVTHVARGEQTRMGGFPLTPTQCFAALLVASIAIMAVELRRRKTFRWWDAFLMLATGLAGCVVATMFFSQHPTTSTNLQVLMLNPLPLFFLRSVLRRATPRRYWTVQTALLLMFLAGGLWQSYAEGMVFLALCLLTRNCSHIINEQ